MRLKINEILSLAGANKQFQIVRGGIWSVFAFSAIMYGTCFAANSLNKACPLSPDGEKCQIEKQALYMSFATLVAGVLGLNTRNPKLRSGSNEEFLEIDDEPIVGPIREVKEEIKNAIADKASPKEIINVIQDPEAAVKELGDEIINHLTEDQKVNIYRAIWRERHHFD